MHPPFGFALFYLRSVAARVPYIDRITKQRIEPVTTGQIYWGAVPFVCIQIVMVALVIMFPQMVMHYKGKVVDPSTIDIKLPDLPGLGAPGGGNGMPAAPSFDLNSPPPINGGGQSGTTPKPNTNDLSSPPDMGGGTQSAPPATDLSKPPSFN
jgi:hypothetical protein